MGLFDFLNKSKKPALVCTHPGMRQVEEYLANSNGTIPYTATQDGEQCKLVLRRLGKAGNKYIISIGCRPDDRNNLKVRVFGLPNIPAPHVNAALLILNEYHANGNTTFFTLSIDSDNDVILAYDLASTTQNPGAVMEEVLAFIAETVAELYPKLAALA